MKVLYYPIVDYQETKKKDISLCGDYVVDCLFHGFRKLLGFDLIDYTQNPLMYKSQDIYRDRFPHKGFSMFGRIDDIEIDRSDIEKKLAANYFDFVVSPIHHTNRNNKGEILKHISYIRNYVDSNRLAVICSDENPGSNSFLFGSKEFTFFKVELENTRIGQAHPIGYSVPRENFVDSVPEKKKDFADLIPSFLHRGHPHEKTYKFTSEEDYFQDYRDSYFGFTCKKGGWDCMRHYEIISQGCVPFFTDIEVCPEQTLFKYPKKLCKTVKDFEGIHPNTIHVHIEQQSFLFSAMENLHTTGHKINHEIFSDDIYYEIANRFLEYGKKMLTTEANAKYILDTMRRE